MVTRLISEGASDFRKAFDRIVGVVSREVADRFVLGGTGNEPITHFGGKLLREAIEIQTLGQVQLSQDDAEDLYHGLITATLFAPQVAPIVLGAPLLSETTTRITRRVLGDRKRGQVAREVIVSAAQEQVKARPRTARSKRLRTLIPRIIRAISEDDERETVKLVFEAFDLLARRR